MAVVQTIIVDMSTRGANPVAYTHQNDEWRTFHFEIYNNGEAVDMTGWSCKVGAILPSNDGGYRVIAGDQMDIASINENYASATLGPPYTSIAGNGILTLIFTTATGHTIRPINVALKIQKSADGPDVIAGASDFPATLEEIVDDWLDENGADNLAAWFDDAITAEDLETYINAWLDNHPEATTTVQDGSVTMAKLNAAVAERFPVATFSDIHDTTADEIDVLKDDSYYGSDQPVTFMKWEHGLTPELSFLQRADGTWMVPKPGMNPASSDVPAQAIGDVVASYINHPEIVYGGAGAFVDNCTNEMDCSIFAQLVLQGISYENSKYNGNAANIFGNYIGGNIPKNKASLLSPRRTSGYITDELAMWFAEQNRLFYIDYSKEHPCSQLQVGDLLFESDPTGSTIDYDTIKKYYLYIHHVAVVLAVYPESDRIVVAQAGGFNSAFQEYTQIQGVGSRRDNIKITTLKFVNSSYLLQVFARPLYGKAERKATTAQGQVYYNDSATVQASGSDAQMAQIFLEKALAPHKMYTLAVKGNLPQYSTEKTNIELAATINGSPVNFGSALHINCGNEFAFSFVPPSEIANASALRLRAFVSSLDESLDSPQTYELDGFSLYEGLFPNITPNSEKIEDPFTVESGVTGERYAWMEDGKLHIHGRFALSSAVASDGETKLATLNSAYFGSIPSAMTITGSVRRFTCYYGGVPHMASINAAGELSVYYKSGEGSNYSTIFDVVI